MASYIHNRVLLVSPTASPIGGVQTWIDNICAGLQHAGWDPLVGLVKGVKTHDPESFQKAHPDLNTVIIDGSGFGHASRVREVIHCIKKTAPEFIIPLTVIDAHDAICHFKNMGGDLRYILKISGNLARQIADVRMYQGYADFSVCSGGLTCRMVEWAGMPKDRIRHVPNGTEKERRVASRLQHESVIKIGYVGRLTFDDKRIMDMIEMVLDLEARRVPFEAVIVGIGPGEADMRQKLAGLIQDGRVRFLGQLNQSELFERIYPNLHVLVLFSESEAFGLSIIEAMMHGVVPVSSRFVGHSTEGILSHGQNALLFPIGEPLSGAEHIAYLQQNPEYWNRLSENARNKVSNNYTWKNCVSGVLRALEDCRKMPPRNLPDRLPRQLHEGDGFFSKASFIPRSVIHAYYKFRRSVMGVPKAMHGGEEWPMATHSFTDEQLQEIEKTIIDLDRLGPYS